GASEIVRNATRAMIESTTAIKGLTGLDVPSLVGGALGRGFGEKLRTGEGNGESGGASATDRISEIAGEGLTTLKAAQEAAKARAATEAAAAKASADEAAARPGHLGHGERGHGQGLRQGHHRRPAPPIWSLRSGKPAYARAL